MSRRVRIVMGVLLSLIAVAGIGVAVAFRQLEPRLHRWVTESLGQSLESQISLGEVHLAWFPLRLTARDLTVRHRGRTDIPPLIVVSSFSVDLKPMDLWSSTVEHVKVDGMEVHIPPKDDQTGKRPMPRPGNDSTQDKNQPKGKRGLVVRTLTATNTRLAVIPKTERKNAKVWDIYELEMDF